MVIVFAFQKCFKRIENAAAAVTGPADRDKGMKLHDGPSSSESWEWAAGILYHVSGRKHQSFLMTFGRCVFSPFLSSFGFSVLIEPRALGVLGHYSKHRFTHPAWFLKFLIHALFELLLCFVAHCFLCSNSSNLVGWLEIMDSSFN